MLDAVLRYRRSPGRPSARDRKSERGLIQHYARAILRVSPLSRLTAAGFATWSPDGTPLDQTRFDRRQAAGLLSIDQPLLSGLVGGIANPPDAVSAGTAPIPGLLARNPMLREEGDRIRFLHRADGRSRLLGAVLNDGLATVLRLTALGPIPTEALIEQTALRLAIPPQEAEALVTAAARAQILVAGPVLDEQSADLLGDAEHALADRCPEAAPLLTRLRDALDLAARGSVTERTAALNRIEATEKQLNALSAAPARLRVNEDYLLAPRTVSRDGYDQPLRDLAAVARFYAMFDRHHDARSLLTRAFVDRFGSGGQAPLLDHAQDLVAEVRARQAALTEQTAADHGPADGSLAALLKTRADACTALGDRLLAARAEEELRFGADWLAELAAAVPDRFSADGASYGMLVQPAGDRLVVNACYPGHGQLTTRFLGQPQADPHGDPPDRLRRRLHALYGSDGPRLVEDHGLHGSNLNHRMRLLDRTMTARDWAAARLVHDPATDRLGLLDGDGAPVRVLSLGMKWIDAQPPALLLAVWLYGPSLVAFDPVERTHRARRDHDARTGGTTAYPRLVAGHCVLQRRRWYPGADLPAPAEPADEVSDLLAVTAWRARHDVPEQIVIKTPLWRMPGLDRDRDRDGSAPEAGTAAQIQQIVAARRREKPQYVDLASALMVRVLPRLMERRRMGYFEEALPEVRTGVHAAEWAVELDRLPSPPHPEGGPA
ncbi:hypothetical protein [Peterkaempfera bronchialis]|uniref:Lantibiotic dehydratase domain protein n=1 Tax=Peterkaempfera bronchialis TaxID=2126346 RepID=A0A345SS25_9ACTN|nr:hypothetical protein [Peterkaempfera bronchialis]AXI76530.1 hypothetical protein C7M71_002630 [Peterkaempfera bronchialis]